MQPDPTAAKISQALQMAKRLHAGGHFAEARRACDAVLALDPGNAGARFRLALLARQAGDVAEAIALLAALQAERPDDIAVLSNLVALQRETGKAGAAEALLDRMVPVLPADARLLLEKGRCCLDREAPAEALAYLAEAARLDPALPQVHSTLGIALRRTGNRAAASGAFAVALKQNPDDPAALNGMGNDLLDQEQFAAAADCYRRAVAVRPGFIKARKNLAYTLSLANDIDGARAAFEELLARYPVYPEGHMDFGLFLLSIGDYARGWQEFEGRWGFEKFGERDWGGGRPRWDGSPLAGRRLLLWGEQGVGDHVLYGTMLRRVLQRAAGPVTIAVEARLVPLFTRAFAGAGVFVADRTDPGAADLQCPFGSMGGFARLAPADFDDGNYMRADPGRSVGLRARYAALGRPGDRLLGLSWRSANWQIGQYKSLDLETLLPVLRRPGTVWVNLQYGKVADEIAALRERHGIVVHQDAEIDPQRDLDGLAAQIAALDAVVSSSNSTVHLAGALGVPCHVLLGYGRGRMWYWPRTGETTPWYASLRLLRQAAPGDWSVPIRRLGEVLDGRP